jgi:hypothetical protein
MMPAAYERRYRVREPRWGLASLLAFAVAGALAGLLAWRLGG